MKLTRKLLVLLFVLALVAAACGGDDDSSDTTAAPADDGGTTETTEAMTDEAPETTEAMADDDGGDDGGDAMAPPTVDVGVDLEAGTISIGMLSDLTGGFGPLVTPIVAGHEAYWGNVNANGGIHGLQVELVVRDTVYDVTNHVTLYEELKDQVVAFGHSTGSPHTLAINEDLQSDGILAIPLTWYSGWSDPAINANLLPHGAPYCIEAMNLIEYIYDVAVESGIAEPTLAIASFPGDYGLDSMEGAKLAADALGIEILHDGSGTIIPGQDLLPVADAITGSGADMVWVTANAPTFSEIYGAAIAGGFEAIWSGAGPTYSPAFLDSPLADALQRDYYGTFYLSPWGSDSPGMQEMMGVFAAANPDAPPTDFYGEGWVEAKIMHEALLKAYELGDMTQAGVVAAAKSLEGIDFNGMAPTETYMGEPNDIVQRQSMIFRPDAELRAAGGTGTRVIEATYTSPTAAGFVFEGACFEL
ncbi:MAG: ABC transporter substrate-binding protein [Acidimicrobiia bacterium]|nr:ABC transporter substrate-binding protein [Acidimicrobiia bacterium]